MSGMNLAMLVTIINCYIDYVKALIAKAENPSLILRWHPHGGRKGLYC